MEGEELQTNQDKPCKHCAALLHFVKTKNGKFAPCEASTHVRSGEQDVLPRGNYYDAAGTFYRKEGVPVGLSVWRSHWDDCPGTQAEHAKKKANAPPLTRE
jgi:hypothetical protein